MVFQFSFGPNLAGIFRNANRQEIYVRKKIKSKLRVAEVWKEMKKQQNKINHQKFLAFLFGILFGCTNVKQTFINTKLGGTFPNHTQ